MAFRREHDLGLQQIHSPQPFRRLIPNLITIAGLCCGLSAVRFALLERWEVCIGFILAAALIDGLDGRAARMLRATSTFGAQLDSLSDFLCFGVAPVLVLYMWGLDDIKRIGWAVVLFYSVCCALRLARFNTAIVDKTQEPWQKNFFVGIPSPAGGLLVLLPLMVAVEMDDYTAISPWFVAIHVVFIAIMMVSRIPTFAAKNIRINPDYVIPVMVWCAFLVVALIIEPWKMLIVLGFCYIATIPFSIRKYRQLQAAEQTSQDL
jgi:CDP-diacylglycerol--serine O-phosphatidyltransferase